MLTILMATLFCSGALLFLDALDVFKAGLKTAYRWFAAGLILFGFSLLQFPVVLVTGTYGEKWATSGVIVIPFILATAFMYVGMRQFARLLNVQTIMTQLWFSLVVVIGLAVGSGFLAHFIALNDVPAIDNETYTATVAWSTGFGVLAWLLVLKIRPVIGVLYRRPMTWLALALGVLVFSGLHEYVISFFLGEPDPYVYWGASLWPFIISGFLFVRAGYAFGATSDAVLPSATTVANPAQTDRAYIDSIVAVSNLASRPDDIDIIMDGLREVTASLVPGAPLTAEQHKRLVDIYFRLENYLTTVDPLRNFSKEQLRQQIDPSLRSQVEQTNQVPPVPTP